MSKLFVDQISPTSPGVSINFTGITPPTWNGLPLGTGGPSPSPPPDSYTDPRAIRTTPIAPTNLTATGAFRTIILAWSMENYRNHAYFNLYRSIGVDDFGVATYLARCNTNGFNDVAVTHGTTYYYWVKAVNHEGVEGPYQSASGVSASILRVGNTDLGPLAVEASNLANNTITASKLADQAIDSFTRFANGLEPLVLVNSLPNPVGYLGPRVVFLTSDSTIYRYTGTAWTSGILASQIQTQLTDSQIQALDAAKLTGTLNVARIADGAIAATKFASGIQPITIVTTVPVSKITDLVFNTTDRKMYRWNGTVYTKDIPSVDIQGSFTDDQIQSLDAAKLIGTINPARIAGSSIDATKFASTIQPITIVSSLPGVRSTDLIYLTTDRKIYRWNGSAYTKDIPSADVVGQIPGTQITDGSITTPKLAANQIDGSVIAAGSLSADKIAANSITAGQIAVGAITVDELASNAVTSAKIAAGQIEAVHIKAGSITGDRIFSGTITTNLLAAGQINGSVIQSGTITTDKLDANAVTAGVIQAGAIGAQQIASGAIRAQHLLVAPKSICTDPLFEGLSTLWTGHVRTLLSSNPAVPAGCPSSSAAEFNVRQALFNSLTTVQPQENYKLTCYVNRGTGGAGAIGVTAVYYDSNRQFLSGQVASTTSSGWQQLTLNATIPASAAFMAFGPWSDKPTFTGTFWATDMSVEKRNDASLIVDGTITTQKLAAGQIDGSVISTNSLNASRILAGSITTDRFQTNSISGTILENGSIHADKITANTITGGALVAGAINTRELASQAVTTNKLLVTGIGASMVPDTNTQDAQAWYSSNPGAFSIVDDTTSPTGKAINCTASMNAWTSAQIPLDRTKNYYLRIYAKQQSGNSTAYLTVVFLDENRSPLYGNVGINGTGWPGTGTYHYFGLIGAQPPSSWTEYKISFGPGETAKIPPNTRYVQVGFLANYQFTGVQRFTNFRLYEKADADLIVDGSIIAGKLAANAIVAGSGVIANAAIERALIADLAVDNAKIAHLTITSQKIADLEVTNAKIASGLDAAKITVGTLNANVIGANTITASKLDTRGLDIKDSLGTTIISSITQIPTTAAISWDLNPQFSNWTSTLPAGWSAWGDGSKISKETSTVRTPPYAVRMTPNSTGDVGLRASAYWANSPLPLNTIVSGSVDLRITADGSTGSPRILIVLFTNSALTQYTSSEFPAPTKTLNVWQRVPFTARVTTTQQIYGFEIYLIGCWTTGSKNWTGTVIFDNVNLEILDATSFDNQRITVDPVTGSLQNIGIGAGTVVDNSRLPSSTNSVYNADFSRNTDGWEFSKDANLPDLAIASATYPGYTAWQVNGGQGAGNGTMILYQGSGPSGGGYYYMFQPPSRSSPVIPGRKYIASVYSGAHRCAVDIYVVYFNDLGSIVGTAGVGVSVNNASLAGGRSLSQFFRNKVETVAPPGASVASVRIRKSDTLAGHSDSYAFLAKVQFEEVGAATTEPGAWVPGPLGYSGDLNATFGADWNTSLVNAPPNLTELNGGEAIQNSQITVDENGNLQGTGTPNVPVDNRSIRNNRNYVRSISLWQNISLGIATKSSGVGYAGDGWGITIPNNSNWDGMMSPLMTLPQGISWSISFLAWTSAGTRTLYVDLFPDSLPGTVESTFTITTSPKVYTYSTGIINSAQLNSCRLRFFAPSGGSGSVFVVNPQLETWSQTPWSANPEDLLSAVTPLTDSNKSQFGFTGDLNATRGAPAGTLVAGVDASTVVTNANAGIQAFNSLATKLSTDARNVFTGAGGLALSTSPGNPIAWNPTTGDVTGGLGVALTNKGIVARNGSINTFVLDASTGDATFAGTLAANIVTATNLQTGSVSVTSLGTHINIDYSWPDSASVWYSQAIISNLNFPISKAGSAGVLATEFSLDFSVYSGPTSVAFVVQIVLRKDGVTAGAYTRQFRCPVVVTSQYYSGLVSHPFSSTLLLKNLQVGNYSATIYLDSVTAYNFNNQIITPGPGANVLASSSAPVAGPSLQLGGGLNVMILNA